jgi:phage terminase small subunit
MLEKESDMTKPTTKRGGARPGAGRPPNEPVLLPNLPATNDPLVFLLALMNDDAADSRTRLSAAVACLPYCHARISEAGIKDQAQTAAKKAGAGKFAPSRGPVRLVT